MNKQFLNALVLMLGFAVFAFPIVAKASEATAIGYDERMIQAAQIALLNARKHSMRRCWHAVKEALLTADVISSRPATRYAKQAGDELQKKYGFKKLAVKDPFDAPIGSVLVYGGHGAGHVEIRTADGFVSDFITPYPSNRPLIGVYIKA